MLRQRGGDSPRRQARRKYRGEKKEASRCLFGEEIIGVRVGVREVLGVARRCRRSGLGKNACSVQSGGMHTKPKNVSHPLT